MTQLTTFPSAWMNTLRTPDDAWTTIGTIAVPANTIIGIEAIVIANRTTHSTGLFEKITGCYRNNAGTATIIGSTEVIWRQSADADWDVRFLVSGSNVLLQVAGDVYLELNWLARWSIHSVSRV